MMTEREWIFLTWTIVFTALFVQAHLKLEREHRQHIRTKLTLSDLIFELRDMGLGVDVEEKARGNQYEPSHTIIVAKKADWEK